MDRRAFLATVTGGRLTAPLAAEAQAARGVPRVGVVMPWTRQDPPGALESFMRGLRALGWVEGQTVIIEARYADGRADRIPGVSKELASLKVNVIVTTGTTAIQAVRDATTDIPIVMAGGGDPVGTGLVTTLARPGGQQKTEALLVANDPFFQSLRHHIVALASRHAIPAIYFERNFAMEGGLISYGPSLRAPFTEDSEGPRPHDSSVTARAGGSGHRVSTPWPHRSGADPGPARLGDHE